jgi:RHS repeat-associated protein
MELASSAFSTGVPASAAIPQLAGNSRQGFQPVASTSRWGSGFSISSNTLGLSTSLYDGDAGSRSPGKERDQESGLDNFGARYFASSMGRFMSPDPLGGHLEDPQTLNKYSYVANNPLSRTDSTGLDFNLDCSKNNGTTCQGGHTYYQDKNGDYKETVVASDKNGSLTDQSGNKYSGTFDGKNVTFAGADGSTSNGSWIQGSSETKGITGGGDLSSKFNFTFSDHGGGNQRLNASWKFSGSNEDAVSALEKAGYAVSSLDNRFNNEHQPPAGGSLIHMRTSGDFLTGADSGHAIIDIYPKVSVPASGELHVGEHNPTTPLGFILHQTEIH